MNNHEPIKLLLKPVFHFLILTNKIRKQTCTVSVKLPIIGWIAENKRGSGLHMRQMNLCWSIVGALLQEQGYMLVTCVVDKDY